MSGLDASPYASARLNALYQSHGSGVPRGVHSGEYLNLIVAIVYAGLMLGSRWSQIWKLFRVGQDTGLSLASTLLALTGVGIRMAMVNYVVRETDNGTARALLVAEWIVLTGLVIVALQIVIIRIRQRREAT